MSKSKFLWLAVEADEYELPLCIADTPKELAKMIGTTSTNVINLSNLKCSGKKTGRKIVKVRRDD